MNNYRSLTKLTELDEAQRQLKRAIDRQGNRVLDSYSGLKDYYTPTNLMASELKSISSVIPFDKLLLVAVAALKRMLIR